MSDPVPFLSPRMVGPRFDRHAVPLELLKDMAVLEEMIVEVAKWRYLEEHRNRQRSPRGFTDGIALKLTEIRDGSVVLGISLFVATTGLFPPESQAYFEQARQRIIGAIDAAENDQSITQHLPERLLGYFDRIGRGLREGEAIEFDPANPERPARLNKVTRRKLLFASSSVQDVTEEVTLRGSVPEVDQARMTFQLELIDGPRLLAPIESQHLNTVLDAFNGYRRGTRVLLQGIGRYNRSERLQAIEAVEHMTVLDANDVGARIEELRAVTDGWLDGKGVAPTPQGLDWFSQSFEMHYPEDLPLPFLYPTAEGGLQAEWSLGDYELSLELDLTRHQGEWHGLDVASKEETARELDLESAADWGWLVAQVKRLAGDAT